LPWLEGGWVVGATVCLYVLACIGLTRWLMVRRGSLLGGGLVTLIAAGILAGVAIRLGQQEQWETAHPLVVIAEEGLLLRRGNALTFPARSSTPLPPGAEARLLFERGDWLQIELASGEVGWVPTAYTLVDR
jgi:hypothetical protein